MDRHNLREEEEGTKHPEAGDPDNRVTKEGPCQDHLDPQPPQTHPPIHTYDMDLGGTCPQSRC